MLSLQLRELTYSVSNLKMTVDSIIPPAAYNAALRERLASGPIKVNYKNYFGFSMSGVGSAFTHPIFCIAPFHR